MEGDESVLLLNGCTGLILGRRMGKGLVVVIPPAVVPGVVVLRVGKPTPVLLLVKNGFGPPWLIIELEGEELEFRDCLRWRGELVGEEGPALV